LAGRVEPDAQRSPKSRLAAASAFLIGALLTLAIHAPSLVGDRARDPFADADVELDIEAGSTPGTQPVLTVPGLPGAVPRSEPSPGPEAGVEIRLIDASTGEAVGQAEVAAATSEPSPGGHDVASAIGGVATLSRRVLANAGWDVFVRAQGYLLQVHSLVPGTDPQVLALRSAPWVHGTVKTPAGRGLDGARVVVRCVGSRRSGALGLFGSLDGSASLSTTDASGNWSAPLPGAAMGGAVEATAWHHEAVQADRGMLNLLALRHPAEAARLGPQARMVDEGVLPSIDLVLVPSVAVRVRLLDASSREPVTVRPTQAEVHLAKDGIRRSLFDSRMVFTPKGWCRTPSDQALRAGRYDVIVPVEELPVPEAVVLVQIPGYLPVRAVVPTAPLEAIGDEGAAATVLVPRAADQEFFSVRTASTRPGYEDLRRSDAPQLAYSARAGVGGGLAYGVPTQEGAWLFPSVPRLPGMRLQLIDGLGLSSQVPVEDGTAGDGGPIELEFDWPRLCGFSPAIVDDGGQRLYGVRVRFSHEEWPLLDGRPRTRLVHQSIMRDCDEEGLAGFQGSRPGRHVLFVDGPGVEYTSFEFSVGEAEVARPRVVVRRHR